MHLLRSDCNCACTTLCIRHRSHEIDIRSPENLCDAMHTYTYNADDGYLSIAISIINKISCKHHNEEKIVWFQIADFSLEFRCHEKQILYYYTHNHLYGIKWNEFERKKREKKKISVCLFILCALLPSDFANTSGIFQIVFNAFRKLKRLIFAFWRGEQIHLMPLFLLSSIRRASSISNWMGRMMKRLSDCVRDREREKER